MTEGKHTMTKEDLKSLTEKKEQVTVVFDEAFTPKGMSSLGISIDKYIKEGKVIIK